MRVHRYVLPGVLLAVFLLTPVVGGLVGEWSTSGRATVLVDETGAADPEGIKGWMTLTDVSQTYGIPMKELRDRLGLPTDLSPETALKDIEGLVEGFEVTAVRDAVIAYRAENPDSAAPLAETTPIAPPSSGGDEQGESTTSETDGPTVDIKGKDTLSQVAASFGVPVEVIAAEAGLPADVDANAALKDVVAQYGIEVIDIRDAVSRILTTQP